MLSVEESVHHGVKGIFKVGHDGGVGGRALESVRQLFQSPLGCCWHDDSDWSLEILKHLIYLFIIILILKSAQIIIFNWLFVWSYFFYKSLYCFQNVF